MIMSDQTLTKNENIIYQLETLASYEPDDLDNPEFDVAYETKEGADAFATVCCVDMATRTLDLIKEIKESWEDLIGNSEERDAFGNVTIAEVDYDSFTKIIRSL